MFGFWVVFNLAAILIVGPDLRRIFIVEAIVVELGLEKSLFIRAVVEEYCNLQDVS